jgi:integrase
MQIFTLSDVSASKAHRFIAELREDKAGGAGEIDRGISVASSNYYLRDCKSFFRWMVKDGRCHENPLIHLEGVKGKADRRHDRRELSLDELHWLIDTTAQAGEIYGMTGHAREMLYRLAVETGLRSKELRSLTRSSFVLDGKEPTVTILAAYAKNRRQDTLPLKPSTAREIAIYLHGKMPTAKAFPMPNKDRVVDMIRADMAAARKAWIADAQSPQESGEREGTTFLSDVDERGLYADFHALRHTFISNLAAGGVHPKTAQRLARHSTITLTMDRYTHMRRDDLAGALDVLPDLDTPQRQRAVATGTHGRDNENPVSLPVSPTGATPSDTRRNQAQTIASLESAGSLGKIEGNIGKTDGNPTTALWRNWQTRRIQNPLSLRT